MKQIFLALGLIFVLNANATIEYSAAEDSKPTPQEVSRNRACFEELASQGCGDPGEDPKHFRSCLNNVHSTLSVSCRKMMSELYGTK